VSAGDKQGSSFDHLIGAYALVRRTGFLRTRLGQALFRSAYFLYKRHLEDPYAQLVRSRPELFCDGNILDVGANIGYTATVFAQAVSPGFMVYAFEPEEFNCKLLQRSAHARKVKGKIFPVAVAVGDADGSVTLRFNPSHHADHRIAHEMQGRPPSDPSLDRLVPLVQLDTFARENGIFDKVSFVKIDVQGYEAAVCRGMRGILTANPFATVSLEYTPESLLAFESDPEDILAEFESMDYAAAILDNGGSTHPANHESIKDALKHTSYLNLLFSRRVTS
jgi:FkbM family methyltransferase